MKVKILSINKWLLEDKHRTAVIYLKDGVKTRTDFISDNELTETEIKKQINEN